MSNLFEIMLDEIYEDIDLSSKKRDKLNFPEYVIIKNGTKVIWKNVKEFLKIMKRPPDHFLNFLNYETSGKVLWMSESKSDGLNFLYKIKIDALNTLLNKYLNECVICKACKCYNTKIIKDKQLRKYYFICGDCNTNYFI
jgi:translation initiation factor 2 beta subunit (eIF-2beta)/eIF-5